MANHGNIFRSLRKGFDYLKNSDEKSDSFRYKALNKLDNFVYSGSYSGYKNRTLFLSLEMDNKSDEYIAHAMSMSVAGVRQTRRRISDELYDTLGSDVVDRILYGDEHACDLIIENIDVIDSTSNSNFILYDVESRLRDSYIGDGSSSFDLLSCKDEMIFLSLFTIERFSNLASSLDSEKINYLLRLIAGETENTADRFVVLKYLSSEKCLRDTDSFLKSHLKR